MVSQPPILEATVCTVEPLHLSLVFLFFFLYRNDNSLDPTFFFFSAQETEAAQQVQFCWSICFRQGSMVTATPTPLRPEVIRVTSLQVSVSGS